MSGNLNQTIDVPETLSSLSINELKNLSSEIRAFLISPERQTSVLFF